MVILVGLVVTAALGYVYRTEVDKAVKKGIREGLAEYGKDSVYTTEVDFMQSHVSLTSLFMSSLIKLDSTIYLFSSDTITIALAFA